MPVIKRKYLACDQVVTDGKNFGVIIGGDDKHIQTRLTNGIVESITISWFCRKYSRIFGKKRLEILKINEQFIRRREVYKV
jgi:hypothetical protein